MMTGEDVSAGKRLLDKIRSRLAMISLRLKVQEGAGTDRTNLVREEEPPAPFLYQG
jgi:hypothetical protein